MLRDNALTTVARLAGFLGIDTPPSGSTLEAQLEASINAVTAFIERMTGRTFKKTTYTEEEYNTEAGQTINLKHYPVITSEPITVQQRTSDENEDSWETIESRYYSIDADSGILTLMGAGHFPRTTNGYRVTYTAGYDFDNETTFLSDTEASDLEMAVWLISQDLYNSKGVNMAIKSEKLGDYSVTYSETAGRAMTNGQAMEIINNYTSGGDALGMGVLTPLQ